MDKQTQAIYEEVRDEIQNRTAPSVMSKRQALAVYEELMVDLPAWIEALEDELRDDPAEGA